MVWVFMVDRVVSHIDCNCCLWTRDWLNFADKLILLRLGLVQLVLESCKYCVKFG